MLNQFPERFRVRPRLRRLIDTAPTSLKEQILKTRSRCFPQFIEGVETSVEHAYQMYNADLQKLTLETGHIVTLSTFQNALAISKPASIIANDNRLLYPFSPQLDRSAYTTSWVYKKIPAIKGHLGHAYFAAADGKSFFHWIAAVLPRLILARSNVSQEFSSYIVTQNRDPYQLDTIRLLGIPDESVVWLQEDESWLCKQLTVSPIATCTKQKEFEPWAIPLMRSTIIPLVKKPNGTDFRRVFLSRANTAHRRLINEEAVYEKLKPFGFKKIQIEDLPLSEQIGIFAHAESIVGIHSAGLSHLMFANSGTSVLEISSDTWKNSIYGVIAGHVGLNYHKLEGRGIRPKSYLHPGKMDVVLDDLQEVDNFCRRYFM